MMGELIWKRKYSLTLATDSVSLLLAAMTEGCNARRYQKS